MTAPAKQLPHTVTYDDDWRITPVILGGRKLWELEYRDPAMRQWHSMFIGETETQAEDAYDAFHEGEQPQPNGVWP